MGCILRGTGAKGKEEYSFGFGQDNLAPGSRSAALRVKEEDLDKLFRKGRGTEVRSLKAEVRRQKAEVRSQ
jgi:hypothetical protein